MCARVCCLMCEKRIPPSRTPLPPTSTHTLTHPLSLLYTTQGKYRTTRGELATATHELEQSKALAASLEGRLAVQQATHLGSYERGRKRIRACVYMSVYLCVYKKACVCNHLFPHSTPFLPPPTNPTNQNKHNRRRPPPPRGKRPPTRTLGGGPRHGRHGAGGDRDAGTPLGAGGGVAARTVGCHD